jgi:hypothetical protein
LRHGDLFAFYKGLEGLFTTATFLCIQQNPNDQTRENPKGRKVGKSLPSRRLSLSLLEPAPRIDLIGAREAMQGLDATSVMAHFGNMPEKKHSEDIPMTARMRWKMKLAESRTRPRPLYRSLERP